MARSLNGLVWLCVLLLLLLLWCVVDPDAPLQIRLGSDQSVSEEDAFKGLHRNLVPSDDLPPEAENGLETIRLTIDSKSAGILQQVRDRGLNKRIIIQDPDDTISAVVSCAGKDIKAELRIKGDVKDHISTDKWSFRIKLKRGRLAGMREFSIQNPSTRGYLWEWFFHQACHREGILAPRSMFVNVVINNNAAGIYFLEEHVGKELLESQSRREGPIIRFDESTMWSTWLQHHSFTGPGSRKLPLSAGPASSPKSALIRAYGERRLTSTEDLNRSLIGAIENMRALQNMAISSGPPGLEQLQAISDLEGKTVDSIMDTDMLGRAHALASLFQVSHSMIWHNQRYYHNPVLGKLEPVMFDNAPQEASYVAPIPLQNRAIIKEFAQSDSYYNAVFRYLGIYTQPEYIELLLKDISDDLDRYEKALASEKPLERIYTTDAMKQRLKAHQIYLKELILPVDPVNFACFYEMDRDPDVDVDVSGMIEIQAWSTTRIPLVVEGFRFDNGIVVSARSCLAKEASDISFDGDSGVVMPRDARHIKFRFHMNTRLATLQNVQQIKQAIREDTDRRKDVSLNIVALYRPIAASESKEEHLYFRKVVPGWYQEKGRPEPPTLSEALNKHHFLTYDFDADRLEIAAGEWDVDGDLVLPANYSLYAGPGVNLRFEEDAVLLSDSRLVFSGTRDNPVVLEPVEGVDTWNGIVVLNAKHKSIWKHTVIRNTNNAKRAGWVMTGGINFYHSPVIIKDCTIEGTMAEDGFNVFGTELLIERVRFVNCVSDSFDGDFISAGLIKNCLFKDGEADGIDLSGSRIDIEDCTFENIGDKAISIGEKSTVQITGGKVNGASIGVAIKDLSMVSLKGMSIQGVSNYAFAVYMKKPEYGPSVATIEDVDIGLCGLSKYIVQTLCTLTVDGVLMPTQDMDVKQMYENKILGN